MFTLLYPSERAVINIDLRYVQRQSLAASVPSGINVESLNSMRIADSPFPGLKFCFS